MVSRDEMYEYTNMEVSLEERARVVLEHAKLHVAYYGDRGITTFRKHLSWYFKTDKLGTEIPGLKVWRAKLVRVSSLDELEKLLKELL